MHNLSGGQRIANAIGLLLSGFGSGASGQPNAALAFLNKQIDNDIEAQKAELGKKENLLSANARQFGELGQATTMTRIMHNDYVSHLLQQAAAKSASPIAQLQAQQAIAQLQQQSAQMQHQLALAGGSTGQGPQNPAALVPLMVPEKQQGEAFKEAGNLEEANKLSDDMKQSFKDISSKFLNGTFSPSDVQSAKKAYVGKIIKLSEGRYNQEAAENLVDALFPSRLDFPETVKNKEQRLGQFLDTLAQAPTLKGYGVVPSQSPKEAKKSQSINFTKAR
jgi:hypothetical protein